MIYKTRGSTVVHLFSGARFKEVSKAAGVMGDNGIRVLTVSYNANEFNF